MTRIDTDETRAVCPLIRDFRPSVIIRVIRGQKTPAPDGQTALAVARQVLENWRQFRADQHRWFAIADTRAELAAYSG